MIENYTTQEHLDPITTKEKLLSRLEEWQGKALEAELLTVEKLQCWKQELKRLFGKEPANFFHAAEQTHLLVRKK